MRFTREIRINRGTLTLTPHYPTITFFSILLKCIFIFLDSFLRDTAFFYAYETSTDINSFLIGGYVYFRDNRNLFNFYHWHLSIVLDNIYFQYLNQMRFPSIGLHV